MPKQTTRGSRALEPCLLACSRMMRADLGISLGIWCPTWINARIPVSELNSKALALAALLGPSGLLTEEKFWWKEEQYPWNFYRPNFCMPRLSQVCQAYTGRTGCGWEVFVYSRLILVLGFARHIDVSTRNSRSKKRAKKQPKPAKLRRKTPDSLRHPFCWVKKN